jgi:putative transcriptional regulator
VVDDRFMAANFAIERDHNLRIISARRTRQDERRITAAQLARMRRVPNPREIRNQLHMTREQFSAEFGLPIGTVRDWEQGLKQPDSAARTLLRVIAHNPDAVIEALKA